MRLTRPGKLLLLIIVAGLIASEVAAQSDIAADASLPGGAIRPAAIPTIVATAAPATGTRAGGFTWSVTKLASPSTLPVTAGSSSNPINYNVAYSRTSTTPPSYSVTGTISVSNGGPTSVPVTVTISGAISAVATCNPAVISGDPPGITTCTYTGTASGDTSTTLTASISASGATVTTPVLTIPITWTGTISNQCITPTDVISSTGVTPVVTGATGSGVEICDSTSYAYAATVPAVTDCTSFEVRNTATPGPFTPATASVSVTVTGCSQTLTITAGTISTSSSTTYSWALTKLSAPASLTVAAGGTGTVDYTVRATQTQLSSSASVTTTATLVNPSATAAVLTSATARLCQNGGSCQDNTLNCGQSTIPAGGQVTCPVSLSATNVDPIAGTLTITAIVGSTTSTSGPIAVDFASATTSDVDKCATISDEFTSTVKPISVSGARPPESGFSICESKEYAYTATFGSFTNTDAGSQTITNTAKLTDLTSTPSITAVTNVPLTITASQSTADSISSSVTAKTVTITRYTWTLNKAVSPTAITLTRDAEGAAGYSVVATQSQGTTTATVAGTVVLSNTGTSAASITASTISASDGSSGPLTCTPPAVPASGAGTTTCSYNITYTQAPTAGTVTASITFADGSIISPSQTFGFTAGSGSYQDFTVGKCAYITDTFSWSGWGSSIIGGSTPIGVRIDPADGKPPTDTGSVGMQICESRTYNYNLLMRLSICITQPMATNIARLRSTDGSFTSLESSQTLAITVTGCDVLPTVGMIDLQTWSALTYQWSMRKQSNPSQIQLQQGQGGTASYTLSFTKTMQTGSYYMSGTIQITNNQQGPVGIQNVQLTSSTGQIQQPTCYSGSFGTGSISGGTTFIASDVASGGINPTFGTTTSGTFILAAGQTSNCQFNVSAGTSGVVPVAGNIRVQVTTSAGRIATSTDIPINFASPTQLWSINDCVLINDNAQSTGAWTPQVTGLPQGVAWCTGDPYTYQAQISAPPANAQCNAAATITNTATASPQGGSQAPITATAVTTVNIQGCVSPPPPTSPSPPIAAAPQLSVSTGRTAVDASYIWSVTKSSNFGDQRVTVNWNATRQVTYTVRYVRTESSSSYIVPVTITVNNPATTPVTLSELSATLNGASVPAECPGRTGGNSVVVSPGAPLVCSFSVNYNLGDVPGQMGAKAVVVGGQTVEAVANAQFDFASADKTGGGSCAVVRDQFESDPVLDKVTFAEGTRPPASFDQGQPICESTTFQYSMTLGPFQQNDCRDYEIVNRAAVDPTTGDQATAETSSILRVTVGGCGGDRAPVIQEENSVVIADVKPVKFVGSSWELSGVAKPFKAEIPYTTESILLNYTISWTKTPTTVYQLTGSVQLRNPSKNPSVTVAKVQVTANPSDATASARAPASCSKLELQPGDTTSCSFNITTMSGSNGSITASVTSATGDPFVSPEPVRYSFDNATTIQSTSKVAGCANLTTGLVVGIPLVPSTGGATRSVTTREVCDGGNGEIKVKVGPFADDMCGLNSLVHFARIAPATGPAVNHQTAAQLDITGCPLRAVADPNLRVSNVSAVDVALSNWTMGLTRNVADRVTLAVDASRGVTFKVFATKRVTPDRSFVVGQVTFEGLAEEAVTLRKADITAFTNGGNTAKAPIFCPDNATTDGLIRVPASPDKIICTFNITGISDIDGALLPLVYTDHTNPVIVTPVPFIMSLAQEKVIGDCANLGVSWRMSATDGRDPKDVPQPVLVVPPDIATGFTCTTVVDDFNLKFGPFSDDQCGTYQFTSTATAAPTGGASTSSATTKFQMVVTGC